MSADEQPQQYAVVVTRPDNPERPDGADLVVRVGPYRSRWWAEQAVDRLNATAHQRSRPEGTTVTVAEYDEAHPHRATLYGATVDAVVDAMRAEGDTWGEWSFPDTWDILRTVHGHGEATNLHRRACHHIDAEGEAIEQQEREERELEEAAAEHDRLWSLIKPVADRRVEKTDPKVVHQAADLLADLLAAADRHPVDRDEARRMLPAVALEAVAARQPEPQPAGARG